MISNRQSCRCSSTLLLLVLVFAAVVSCKSSSKYSKEANEKSATDESAPFRMQKFNLIWQKAQKMLSGQKLKNMKSDLKHLDKEELSLKKIKSEGGDKEGLKEASLRKQLSSLLAKYGLERDHVAANMDLTDDSGEPPAAHDYIFKDKKLNKLWAKAERGLFTDEQLAILKEEFQHHQEKIDQYYHVLNQVDEIQDARSREEQDRQSNSISQLSDDSDGSTHRPVLSEHHNDLKRGYERLAEKISLGPTHHPDDGVEPLSEDRVARLWKLAQQANFAPAELDSLREELVHFENRIRKLRRLELDDQLARDSLDQQEDLEEKSRRRVKDLRHKVDKTHDHLHDKISRRIEL